MTRKPPEPYRAGPWRWLVTFVRVVVDMARICVPTIFESMRGSCDHARIDGRIQWYVGRVLSYADVRVRVVNPEGVRLESSRPTIVMSNHRSHFDIPVLYSSLSGTIRMLTKKELFRIPVFGQALRAAEFVRLDRSNHERALAALETAREQMDSGVIVWISPEGTRSRDGSLGPFKKGGFMLALQSGADIIPVGIRGTERVLPASNFFRLRCGEQVSVHIGRPISAREFSVERRDEFVQAVRRRILELAGEAEPAKASAVP